MTNVFTNLTILLTIMNIVHTQGYYDKFASFTPEQLEMVNAKYFQSKYSDIYT